MENVSKRFSSICMSYIVCIAIAGLVNMSAYWYKTAHPEAKIGKVWVKEFPNARENKAKIIIPIDFDLSSAFNWNTKELFVYITAHYNGITLVDNDVVIWNEIIEDPNSAKVKGKMIEGIIKDAGKNLLANEITLSFNYNYIPLLGIMHFHHVTSKTFQMPNEYYKFKPNSNSL